MSTDTKPREKLRVTDKRLFTADGDVRDEYRGEIKPVAPEEAAVPPAAEAKRGEAKRAEARPDEEPEGDPLRNPGTPFTLFLESLIVNAYMSLGLLQNPYQPEATVDLKAARQLIDIIDMLKQKTEGNLKGDEEAYLDAHLTDLKLAFVRSNKAM